MGAPLPPQIEKTDFVSMMASACGLLLTLLASLALPAVMLPVEGIGWLLDRLRGRARPVEADGLEMDEL